ncbi:NAD(P)/FAD-dependent oxidoreductase [Halobacteriaceae archaeon GCM10025711]
MRVAVLGAGYAGLLVAHRLERTLPDDVELVVVDESPDHLIQHELHRVIRRPSFANAIRVPLDDLLDRAERREDRVERVDTATRTVELAETAPVEYDVAAVCLGAETDFTDRPGVREHATPLKRVGHAEAIRERFLDVLDDGGGTVVVGGAGLSGIQVAGELAAFAREELMGDAVRILLVEQFDSVAPSFAGEFQAAVRRELEAAGVEVLTGVSVTGASDAEIRFDGEEPVAYDQFVWTGGIRGPDALGGERPVVNSTLALDDRTFVVGDAGRVVDAEGEAVPASAQAATREARVAATNIERLVAADREGDVFRPRYDRFTFEARGWLVSVGDAAVAQVGPSVFTGPAAKTLKAGVGASYLTSAGAIHDAIQLVREEFRTEAEAD